MKVRDVISELKKHDPESEVGVQNFDSDETDLNAFVEGVYKFDPITCSEVNRKVLQTITCTVVLRVG